MEYILESNYGWLTQTEKSSRRIKDTAAGTLPFHLHRREEEGLAWLYVFGELVDVGSATAPILLPLSKGMKLGIVPLFDMAQVPARLGSMTTLPVRRPNPPTSDCTFCVG